MHSELAVDVDSGRGIAVEGEVVPVEAPAEGAEAPVSQEEAPEGSVPEGGGQEDPMMQLAQLFAQGLQNQDC